MSRLVAIACLGLAVAVPARAERLFGLTTDNRIVTFDSTAPDVLTGSAAISGLNGDTLTGLDFRATNRSLYAVGTSGNLYQLSRSGNGYAANTVGALSPTPAGSSFGIDFNPTVDRLRFLSNTAQNLRINPDTAATIVDGNLTLNGNAFGLIGAAYTNNRSGATATMLFGLDAATGNLVRATNANAGTYVNTTAAGAAFGPLGVALTGPVGFDISGGSGRTFLSAGGNFYTVDRTSGAATLVGALASELTGVTAGAVPEPASWAMLITGFGLTGTMMRRRKLALA